MCNQKLTGSQFSLTHGTETEQEAQLSQRGRAMPRFVEYFG